MNTIFAQRRARLLEMKALRDSYLPPDRAVRCPECGAESSRRAVTENLSVCPRCGYHFPIGAYHRLSQVLDSGSFRELNANLYDLLFRPEICRRIAGSPVRHINSGEGGALFEYPLIL